MLSNPHATFFWLFVESKTPPWALVHGLQLRIPTEQKENPSHAPKATWPGSRAAPVSWADPQATGLLGNPWAGPGPLLFFLSHLHGPLPLPALWYSPCHSFRGQDTDSGRVTRSHHYPPNLWSFSTTCHPGHVWTSGKSGHSSCRLILNSPALNLYKLHPASAIPVLSAVFCQHRSWDDKIYKESLLD